MKQVATDGHHNQKYRVLVEERERHLFPKEIVVHLVEQALAFAPIVVEFNYFKVCHLPLIGHYCTVNIAVVREQVAIAIFGFDATFAKGLVDGFVNRCVANYRICEINSAKRAHVLCRICNFYRQRCFSPK